MINKSWQVPRTLIPLALVAAAAASFIAILDEVVEGDTRAIDAAIILAFRVPGNPADPIGPPWAEETMRDITALGSAPTLVIAVLAVAGFLALAKAWRLAIFTLAACGGGLVVSSLLKYTVDRPRPDLVPHGNLIYTSSFPSGHSMMSAVVYLTLAALVVRLMEKKRLKSYALGIAMALTLLVGVSRIYLGVHWPSDVLAGWAAGAAWALGCWLIARWVGLGRDDGR
jgi:undecaprenyl-diphosphatase